MGAKGTRGDSGGESDGTTSEEDLAAPASGQRTATLRERRASARRRTLLNEIAGTTSAQEARKFLEANAVTRNTKLKYRQALEEFVAFVDERALSQAAAWGHKECVRYLVAARCPGWDAYDEAWSPGSPQW